MTPADYQALGLYDPRSPQAAGRLELLEWLAERGVTSEQMVAAFRENALSALAADLKLRPGGRLTAHQVAAKSGLPLEQVLAISLAAGLPPSSPDEPIYGEEHLRLYRTFAGASALFGEAATRRFIRIVGSALARISEAAVALFQVSIEGPLRRSGGTELDLAKQNLLAIESLDDVRAMLQSLFGAHMETAIRRMREARPSASGDSARLAIGFVDIVGFTSLSHRLNEGDLGDLIEGFEETAHDVTTARDGRVVKLIGDEVMFVTRDPQAACDIALTLVERFSRDASVTPRGGLAYGDLLMRGGDYYGPIVNLASRIAELAVPSEVLTTREVRQSIDSGELDFLPAGRRMLKGFEGPVELFAVDRAPADASSG